LTPQKHKDLLAFASLAMTATLLTLQPAQPKLAVSKFWQEFTPTLEQWQRATLKLTMMLAHS